MKQQDFDSQYFAPRPQHQQLSPQRQQQMQLPPQQMYMQMPQQTMPGGNYAPNGMPLNQQGNGMFGQPMVAAGMSPYVGPQHAQTMQQQQQPPMPDYSNLQNEWFSTQKDIRNIVSDDEAIENMEKMKDLVDKINGSAEGNDTSVAIGNIGHVVMLIDQVLTCLANPTEWLPPSRAKYAEQLIKGGTPIANALKKYSTQIEKLKVQ